MATASAARDKKKTYEDLVAEGRDIVRERDGTNWKAGDLALDVEALPPEEQRKAAWKGEMDTPLKKYAEDIDVNYKTLTTWRATSAAWPGARRRSSASWDTHRTLNAQPDRFDLITEVQTRAEARKIVQSRDTPKGSPDVLPSTFGDRLVYALGQLTGRTDSIENLLRANDGRKFRDRHMDMCRRTAVVLKAQYELMDRIGSGEFEAIEAQTFMEILNAPWQNELKS